MSLLYGILLAVSGWMCMFVANLFGVGVVLQYKAGGPIALAKNHLSIEGLTWSLAIGFILADLTTIGLICYGAVTLYHLVPASAWPFLTFIIPIGIGLYLLARLPHDQSR